MKSLPNAGDKNNIGKGAAGKKVRSAVDRENKSKKMLCDMHWSAFAFCASPCSRWLRNKALFNASGA